jgi:hypothetical protein
MLNKISIYKKTLFIKTCIVVLIFTTSFTYKQVKIPLDNEKGIPYIMELNNRFYSVDGFEIDNKGNFYFLGGGYNPTLVCYSGSIIKFRKKYTEFCSNPIHIIGDTLALFDRAFEKDKPDQSNSLIILSASNGNIINKFPHTVTNNVNSCSFMDTSLILEVWVDKENINSPPRIFLLYSLAAKFIKQIDNAYNLPELIYPARFKNTGNEYLGEWNNNFVYWYIPDKNIQKIFLINKEGVLIASTNIDKKLFGESFFWNPPENRKLRNGNIYVLGHQGTNAVITILPVKDLFNIPVKADSIK